MCTFCCFVVDKEFKVVLFRISKYGITGSSTNGLISLANRCRKKNTGTFWAILRSWFLRMINNHSCSNKLYKATKQLNLSSYIRHNEGEDVGQTRNEFSRVKSSYRFDRVILNWATPLCNQKSLSHQKNNTLWSIYRENWPLNKVWIFCRVIKCPSVAFGRLLRHFENKTIPNALYYFSQLPIYISQLPLYI